MPLYASLFFYLKGKISYFTMKKYKNSKLPLLILVMPIEPFKDYFAPNTNFFILFLVAVIE
jgi:hypothetical protein